MVLLGIIGSGWLSQKGHQIKCAGIDNHNFFCDAQPDIHCNETKLGIYVLTLQAPGCSTPSAVWALLWVTIGDGSGWEVSN